MKISQNNIEKCPSILYRNVSSIKDNIEFLKREKISFSNIETCLHVLSTDSSQLRTTYKYVVDNYGLESVNRNTSILSVNKDLIVDVENLNITYSDKADNLSLAAGISFGATTLEEIQKIMQSKEYKEHPEMFTSQVLARATLEEIQKIMQSEEYKEHPEMFTSTTLAHAKLEDISKLLGMDCWRDDRFKRLLTSSVVARSKSMLEKIPKLIKMAEEYGIDEYLNTSFLILSVSQNYALIRHLENNNLPLIVDGSLNKIFGKQPRVLKKKYNIDINELIKEYPFEEKEKGVNRL